MNAFELPKTHIVLASASPRRKQLLAYAVEDFEVVVSGVEEVLPEGYDLRQAPAYLAELKATDVAGSHPDALVIGADTGVFIDGQMLGKPKNREQAKAMLQTLSGRPHEVRTGCCVIYQGQKETLIDSAMVYFYPLSDDEIEAYLDCGEYADKAGAYGIQGRGALLIEKVDGDYYNVMGLPVARLTRMMERVLAR